MAIVADKSKLERLVALKREKLRRDFPKLYNAVYHHLNTHFKRMRFDERYSCLLELYKALDLYKQVCWRKSVQTGVSEALIASSLEEASKGLRVLYVLPNIDLRGKYVKDRIDPLLKVVPLYKSNVENSIGESESIGMKHYGRGILNFVGSNGASEFISFPADVFYIEEVDKCDQRNLELAKDRLDASDYKFERYVGNPSVENWGIDKKHSESSQAVWMIKCLKCGTKQPLDWFSNVVEKVGEKQYKLLKGTLEEPKLLCVKCKIELDRFSKGEWVHKFPQVELKGFHISQLFSANVSLSELAKTFFKALGNELKLQVFFNSKLGLPYSSSDNKITFDLLEKAAFRSNYFLKLNETINHTGKLYVGIDVGKYFHIVARERLSNGKKRLVFIGKFLREEEVTMTLRILSPNKAVADKNPETRIIENIKGKINRLYSCEFSNGRTIKEIDKSHQDYKKQREIKIDRTLLLDCVLEKFSKGEMINPENAKDIDKEDLEVDWGEYYSQMMASTRVFDEEYNGGSGKFVWREADADHYMFAEAYCELAERIDDHILEYYEGETKKYEGMNKFEMEAKRRREEKIVPDLKTEEGRKEAELIDAYTFLDKLKHKNLRILGENENVDIKKVKKERADYE